MSRLLKSAIPFLLFIGFATTLAAQPPKQPAEPGPPIPNDPVLDVNLKKTFLNLRIRRPICITNAGDGSNRLFIAEQQGVIHVLPNDPEVEETKVFLDMEREVHFNPRQNEEGFLGLAFHPDYKNNGHFYVYYTTRREANLSVISQFTVSKDDPDKADPASEVVLMTIPQPYWNHNGGAIEFGPDGYLYIGLGDGGSANDPHGNGQKLSTLLGSILRIDVDNQDPGLNYAIPKDNPFTESPFTRPEIYAYGIRNIWRLSFDRKTGALWAADVGQDLWEEINIVTKGGNYGWNKREGNHSFPPGSDNKSDQFIDPIFEYHHNVGKSITGGFVYRGKNVPELDGKYLYADYVTGKVWALDYDQENQKVKENYRIEAPENPPVIAFGEDEQGEVYMSGVFGDYGALYTFESKKD